MNHDTRDSSESDVSDHDHPWRDESILRRLYNEEGLPSTKIADRFGCGTTTVLEWMERHGIERRPHPSETPLEDRFWSKVDKGSPGECWEWTAASHPMGYGILTIKGETQSAHRVGYRLQAEDPGDNDVLHHCDNPACVNANHLYPGTQSDNLKDAYERGQLGRGTDHVHSCFTDEELAEVRERLRGDELHREIAADYGVDRSTISKISAGDSYSES